MPERYTELFAAVCSRFERLIQNSVDDPAADGEEKVRYGTDEKSRDYRADTGFAAEQQTDAREHEIHDDADDAELLFELIGNDDGHKVIGSGSRVRADDEGHAEGEDDTAGGKHDKLEIQLRKRNKYWRQQKREKIDDRAAADHA